MFEFDYDEIDEIEEERRRRLRRRGRELTREEANRIVDEADKRIREMLGLPEPQFGPSEDLTKADIDKMTNEISAMVEIAAPEVSIPENLLKEGIHVGNN